MNEQDVVSDYAKVAVARYLEKNGFSETLNAFLRESGQNSKILAKNDLNDHSGESDGSFEDLEILIGERLQFCTQMVSEKLKEMTVNDRLPAVDTERHCVPSWNTHVSFSPMPLGLNGKDALGGLPITVSFCEPDDSIIVATSSKEVRIYREGALYKDLSDLSKKKGIVRLCGSIGDTNWYYLCYLDGTLKVVSENSGYDFKVHQRSISHIYFIADGIDTWRVVSCGSDNYLKLHRLHLRTGLFEELSKLQLPSPCTSLQVARNKGTHETMIFLARQDFTHIVCFTIVCDRLLISYKIALNNSQFNAFSFNVRDMIVLGELDQDGIAKLSPKSTLVVATSHIPFMRLLLVEIPASNSDITTEKTDKVFYDKVLRNMATDVAQDSYSQPVIRTLRNGNGIIAGGNQGIYAIDIDRGDSWPLDLSQISAGKRIKCIQTNRSSTKLVICLQEGSSCLFKLDIKS